ncbi:uncharacterized protein TNCV_3275711 [Trichonephila clavipes]|nr:uncharacterized protein TNCV_3275711 [Trichonephila clavipes]
MRCHSCNGFQEPCCNKTILVLTRQGCHKTVLFPYLSPIEYIWDHLGRRVRHSMSLNELEASLQQIRNEMSQDIIQILYASMPDRVASCIRTRGVQKGIKSFVLLPFSLK